MKFNSDILEEIKERYRFLKRNSTYNSTFDISIYDENLTRLKEKSASFVHQNAFELINTYVGCQNCHQAFQLDTYGDGCLHDCVYCFAKNHQERDGRWNNPFPLPIDITEIWSAFYFAFESKDKHPWKSILSKKIPLRLGANSDCFMSIDKKFGVTKELLNLLEYYNYPYLIVTRSTLIGEPEYLKLLNKNLAAIHISIPSLNENLSKKIEPFAPAPKERLETVRRLTNAGFWVTVRVNPLIPCYPDGYFTRDTKGTGPDFFNFNLIDEIGKAGAQSLLAGFITMDLATTEKMSAVTGFDLKTLLTNKKSNIKFTYDSLEIKEYYKRIKEIGKKYGMEFTSCYLGSGEPSYFDNQELWDNLDDCCNAKNRVKEHKIDSFEISNSNRSEYLSKQNGIIKNMIVNICMKIMKFIMKGMDEKR